MKRFLIIGAGLSGLLAFVGSVSAADLVVDEPFDWTGLYLGVHGGYGGANVDGEYDLDDGPGDFMADSSGSFDLDLDGFLGGVQAGYNWQTGNLVLGIEGDVTFVDWSDSLDPNGDGEVVSANTDFVGTIRARAGFGMDNLLVYATAGAAITDTEFTASDGPGDDGSIDFNDVGLVVGGGAEYALNQNWSIKAEGLYFIFNDDVDASGLTSDSDTDDHAELNDAWMARLGVNFRF